MRRRAIAAAAAFSAALAIVCLVSVFASASPGPAAGLAAGLLAAAALARSHRQGSQERVSFRLCPRTGRLFGPHAQGEAQFRLAGATRSLICLVQADRPARYRAIWRDSVAPEAFRRVAAYGRWQRVAAAHRPELIARKAVTERQSIRRIGWPRGQ